MPITSLQYRQTRTKDVPKTCSLGPFPNSILCHAMSSSVREELHMYARVYVRCLQPAQASLK